MSDRSYTLSLAMIVKNEAENLEKCLSTARPHVDEIVVVDTGSTDGTRAIAQRYADVFDEIAWPDSFSLARNHSFDLATGDYIIWLDGDEYIEAPDDWGKIHEALETGKIAALRLLIYNVFSDRQLFKADQTWLIRLVRNHPMIRFSGRVHNQISGTLKAYVDREHLAVVDIDAKIKHVGYALTSDQSKNKYNPRLDLLKHEANQAKRPSMKAYYQYQLGVGYYMVQQYADADEVLGSTDIDLMNKRNAYYAHYLAGDAARRSTSPARALRHATRMMEMNPKEPLGYALAGMILQSEEDRKEALLLFEAALKRVQQEGGDVRFLLNRHVLQGHIASIAIQLGMVQRAYNHYRTYAELHSDDAQVQKTLGKLEKMAAQKGKVVTG